MQYAGHLPLDKPLQARLRSVELEDILCGILAAPKRASLLQCPCQDCAEDGGATLVVGDCARLPEVDQYFMVTRGAREEMLAKIVAGVKSILPYPYDPLLFRLATLVDALLEESRSLRRLHKQAKNVGSCARRHSQTSGHNCARLRIGGLVVHVINDDDTCVHVRSTPQCAEHVARMEDGVAAENTLCNALRRAHT